MPTNQPSSAPDDLPAVPNDADTAATVLNDDALGRAPGGGGLAPGSGSEAGHDHGAGGASPNSPIDVGADAGDADAAAEAGTRSANDGTRESPAVGR